MEEFQDRLSKVLRIPVTRTPDGEELMAMVEWAPAVDISEDDSGWLVKADLPEVKKEAIKVIVDNGVLSITGERKFEKEEKGRRYHRVERAHGTFVRSFTLPEGADGGRVSAEFKDGVLTVHLQKGAKAKSRPAEVKVT
jgi:HSP20 family protein